MTGHGNEEIGANIRWDSLLNLVKLFEQKADEIFVTKLFFVFETNDKKF